MPHDGEVNRARIMPQNSNIIATKSPNSNVYVYDWTKYIPSSSGGPAKPPTKPQQTCTGHDAEGYGLVWSPHEQGKLLSGSDDGKLCLWDTHRAGAVVEPFQCREGHNGMVIEDVDWHRFHANTYGSVGDDGGISLWDLREGGNTSKETIPAHSGDANGLSFCPLDEFLMASGGSDKVVKLWDMRNTKHPLHALESPTDVVVQVSFSPFAKEVLACSCKDRKIYMWNLSKVRILIPQPSPSTTSPDNFFCPFFCPCQQASQLLHSKCRLAFARPLCLLFLF